MYAGHSLHLLRNLCRDNSAEEGQKANRETQVTVENFHAKIEFFPGPNKSINGWEKRINRAIIMTEDDISH
jgi:hypothetical protein